MDEILQHNTWPLFHSEGGEGMSQCKNPWPNAVILKILGAIKLTTYDDGYVGICTQTNSTKTFFSMFGMEVIDV